MQSEKATAGISFWLYSSTGVKSTKNSLNFFIEYRNKMVKSVRNA